MYSYRKLRNRWLERGANWFSDVAPYTRPVNWDPYEQLALAGFDYDIQRRPTPSIQTTYVRNGKKIPFVLDFWNHDDKAVKAA